MIDVSKISGTTNNSQNAHREEHNKSWRMWAVVGLSVRRWTPVCVPKSKISNAAQLMQTMPPLRLTARRSIARWEFLDAATSFSLLSFHASNRRVIHLRTRSIGVDWPGHLKFQTLRSLQKRLTFLSFFKQLELP